MTIGNKSLLILVGCTLVWLVMTVLVLAHKPSQAKSFQKDSLLIQGLDLPLIAQVKVASDGKKVTLARQDEQFVVADRSNYAASNKEMNALLLKVLEIRRSDLVSESADAHKELGVLDDEKTTKVELLGKDGKALACVLIGGPAKGGNGNYVRLANEKAVYISSQGIWGITADPPSYLRKTMLEAPKDDIVSVTVAGDKWSYKIARDAQGNPDLQGIPAGKRLKQPADVDETFSALTSLGFDDVSRVTEGVTWTATYTCRLKNDLTYTFRVGTRAGQFCIAGEATGPSEEALLRLQEELQKKNTPEELKKKDALLTSGTAAAVFNSRHKGWVYLVSEFKAKPLSRSLADLIEDVPPATKPATAPASKPAAPATKPAMPVE